MSEKKYILGKIPNSLMVIGLLTCIFSVISILFAYKILFF